MKINNLILLALILLNTSLTHAYLFDLRKGDSITFPNAMFNEEELVIAKKLDKVLKNEDSPNWARIYYQKGKVKTEDQIDKNLNYCFFDTFGPYGFRKLGDGGKQINEILLFYTNQSFYSMPRPRFNKKVSKDTGLMSFLHIFKMMYFTIISYKS